MHIDFQTRTLETILPWSLEMSGLYQNCELSCTNLALIRFCVTPASVRDPSFDFVEGGNFSSLVENDV